MKKITSLPVIFILIIKLISSCQLFSQAPAIQWQNTISSNQSDVLYTIKQTADNGYILGGYSSSGSISGDKSESGFGDTDYWILKLDDSGNILWDNVIGGSNADYIADIEVVAEGGYMLAGWSWSPISGEKTASKKGLYDCWVIKLNAAGSIEWQKTYGGSGGDACYSIEKTIDGGYILGGYSDSNISGDKTENSNGYGDFWIIKIDDAGNIEWQNTIGGSLHDDLVNLHQTTDGGYILGGTSTSPISGDKTENTIGPFNTGDFWIVKLGNTGDIEWQETIGSDDYDLMHDIQLTSDAGYITGGHTDGNISGDKTESSIGSDDYWIVKIDPLGNVEWDNTIGGVLGDYLETVQQTTDEGYIVGGHSFSDISGDKTENNIGDPIPTSNDYWILKLDNAGNILWQNTIGGSSNDTFGDLQLTNEGGYILAGTSNSPISGDKTETNFNSDYWIIKLEPEVCAIPTGLFEDNITPTKATLHWDVMPGIEFYHVWYRAVGDISWIKKTSAFNYRTIKSLIPGTEYEYKVRTKCGDGSFTDFSVIENFTTLPLREGEIIGADDFEMISIYPNPNSGEFTIDLSEINSEEITSVVIKNLMGEEVYSEQLNSAQQIINLGRQVAEGVYLVEVHTSETIITKQVVVQR